MILLDLPNVVLLEIFEYLSYEDISKNRAVCRRFDQICQHALNGGFNRVIRQHAISFKRIKALLPRRESERRNHWLARHADILTSIETRISMLSMTYSKCCFIPGRVLDEIQRILRLIANTQKPLRPHEVLQELRDISSMAIEHFDEKIAPTLKKTILEHPCKGVSGYEGLAGLGGGGHSHGSAIGSVRYAASALGSVVVSYGTNSAGTPGGGGGGLGVGVAHNRSLWQAATARGGTPPSAAVGGSPSAAVGSSAAAANVGSLCGFHADNNKITLHALRSLSGARGAAAANGMLGGASRSSILATHFLQQQQQHEHEHVEQAPTGAAVEAAACSRSLVALVHCKKLDLEQKKLNVKMQRMYQLQSRRLQQALNAIAEQNTQIVELKKRLEDVDAKNREISANIKQFNNGEPAAVAVAADEPVAVGVALPGGTGTDDDDDDVTANCSNIMAVKAQTVNSIAVAGATTKRRWDVEEPAAANNNNNNKPKADNCQPPKSSDDEIPPVAAKKAKM